MHVNSPASRRGEQGGRDLDDGISPDEMLAKPIEDRRRSRGCESEPFPPAGHRGGDLDGGDAGEIDPIGRVAARQASHPGCANLLDVTLDEALESTKYAATSTPIADDGFRQRLSLDGDRLISGDVVFEILRGIGESG